MHTIVRAFAIFCIFGLVSVGWLTLGAVMTQRSNRQANDAGQRVADLWGAPQVQRAPFLTLTRDGAPGEAAQWDTTRVAVDLHLDQRMKGLRWFALYDVDLAARWQYRHEGEPALATFRLDLPSAAGVYDGFVLLVDGEPQQVMPEQGMITIAREVEPGDMPTFEVRYKSRGEGSWQYEPSAGAGTLRDFELAMTTNFDEVDFPAGTMSPSSRTAEADGQKLVWRFDQIVTNYGIGTTMPQRIQPGELAASLAFSAPISLFFYFLILAVLARLRDLDIHPINYLFLGAAFFSFHLLFAYSVDRIPTAIAFGIASVVSVVMVTAYLRLVVSDRFAFREAAIAQLVYLVGFGLAHFLDGFTGLTLTVLSIATLFVVMLLTGRIRWSQTLAARPPQPFTPTPGLRPLSPVDLPAPPPVGGS